MARDSGEPVLASVARRKALELVAEGVTTSDPGENDDVRESSLKEIFLVILYLQ